MTALAWKDDVTMKRDAVARMREHHDTDTIIQGTYQQLDHSAPDGYRGCLIGCLCADPNLSGLEDGHVVQEQKDWHYGVELQFGISRNIALLLDYCFETIPAAEAPTFALEAAKAIPVGADLDHVPRQWMVNLLIDAYMLVQRRAVPRRPIYSLLYEAVHLHRLVLDGWRIHPDEWRQLRARCARSEPGVVGGQLDLTDHGRDVHECILDAIWDCADPMAPRWTMSAQYLLGAWEANGPADDPNLGRRRRLNHAASRQASHLLRQLAEAPCPNLPQPTPRTEPIREL